MHIESKIIAAKIILMYLFSILSDQYIIICVNVLSFLLSINIFTTCHYHIFSINFLNSAYFSYERGCANEKIIFKQFFFS